MNKNKIIKLAREAGFTDYYPERLTRFAALVAAHVTEALTKSHETAFQSYVDQAKADRELEALAARLNEREACAKVCEEGTALTAFQSKDCYSYARNRAAAIRERSADLCQNSNELVETDVSEPPRHRYAGNFGE